MTVSRFARNATEGVPHHDSDDIATEPVPASAHEPLASLRRQLLCMLLLLPVFAGSYYLAYWLRFDGRIIPDAYRAFAVTLPWVIVVKLALFAWFRVYQGWGRYVTFHDLLMLAEAATGSSLLLALVDYLFFPGEMIPRSVFLMDWGATIVVIGGLRAVVRLVQEHNRLFFFLSEKVPTLIVGTSDSGESLLRDIHRNKNLSYHVAGFITADSRRVGSRIGGVPVIGTLRQLPALCRRYGVREVLITAGELSGRQIRSLVEEAQRHSLQVKVLPSYEQLLGGSVAVQPREVSIEDLLRRDPVTLDMDNIRHWIDGRVLLVTGSAGSIGSEICRQLLQFSPAKLVLVDRSENGQFFLERELRSLRPSGHRIEVCIADVTDRERMRSVLARHRPDVIFHAAAYKHVPLMEANPGEAIKNVVLATRCLADLAVECGAGSLVMISSDKAVNPTNVMGACKRLAELYVQSLADVSDCRFVTVRFGNVLDSAGSVVPIFREQIAHGGPVTVTDPRMQRYFMTIPEASQLVIQAGAMGQGGEIFVLDMGEPVRIVDLAHDMIHLSGLRPGEDVEIEFVGLRPGEKLFEELHVDGERHLATRHPKIMVADRVHANAAAIAAGVQRLAAASNQPVDTITALLREVLPEYRPPHHDTHPPRRIAA